MKKLTKKQLTEDLRKLVSFRTLTSDLGENKKALDFVVSKINKRAKIRRIKNKDSEMLIASNVDTKSPDVSFFVHVDVVACRSEQFEMKVKNGVVKGRGVSDMKFSIPIGYTLLNNLKETKSKLSFAFVVTTDEETGGFNGASFLANVYGFKPKALIVPDGGDDFVFINKAKGVCCLRIDSKGRPAHSSRIWNGKNALEPLIKLCGEILKRYEKNNKKETMKTTVNIGKLQGGISNNQVCPEAFCVMDFRYPETTSFGEIFNEVSSIAKGIDPTLKISTESKGMPTFVDTNKPIVKKFIKCIESEIGRKVEIKSAYGASDARHFAKQGVPVLMIKPNGGDIHGDNENINLDSCIQFYEATLKFLINSSKLTL